MIQLAFVAKILAGLEFFSVGTSFSFTETLKCQLKRKQNWHSLFVKIFQVSADEGMGN